MIFSHTSLFVSNAVLTVLNTHDIWTTTSWVSAVGLIMLIVRLRRMAMTPCGTRAVAEMVSTIPHGFSLLRAIVSLLKRRAVIAEAIGHGHRYYAAKC